MTPPPPVVELHLCKEAGVDIAFWQCSGCLAVRALLWGETCQTFQPQRTGFNVKSMPQRVPSPKKSKKKAQNKKHKSDVFSPHEKDKNEHLNNPLNCLYSFISPLCFCSKTHRCGLLQVNKLPVCHAQSLMRNVGDHRAHGMAWSVTFVCFFGITQTTHILC